MCMRVGLWLSMHEGGAVVEVCRRVGLWLNVHEGGAVAECA
jgi:hypothetical protein